MRIFLVMALSSALTGSLFFTRTVVAQLNGNRTDIRNDTLPIVHLSPQQLQSYAGLYDFPQIGLTFRVTAGDSVLLVQTANRPGPVSTMLPTGKDHFISREGEAVECWFDLKAGTLSFTQRGKMYTGKKQ